MDPKPPYRDSPIAYLFAIVRDGNLDKQIRSLFQRNQADVVSDGSCASGFKYYAPEESKAVVYGSIITSTLSVANALNQRKLIILDPPKRIDNRISPKALEEYRKHFEPLVGKAAWLEYSKNLRESGMLKLTGKNLRKKP
jgi:hypothetical protein